MAKRIQIARIAAMLTAFVATGLITIAAAAGRTDKTVTFNRDVAPIFFAKCAECHRDGEVAPMSLLTYKEARPWARSIKEKVVKREMPPWHADPAHGSFRNDRRLSDAEIGTIVAWIDGGAREGDAKDLPAAPKFYPGWNIGKPDETFSIPEQNIPAEGVVAYQYFTVPTNFKEDRWITAAEIRSTGRRAVHHVIVFVQEPGATGRAGGRLLVGVAPGEQPAVFPPGFAKKIPAGSKLVFQMHYTPNGAATKDISTVGLIYAKGPVEHAVETRPVLDTKFTIPPGDANHEVRSQYTFTRDAHLTSFMPHMHLRGKDFIYTAVFPDGTKKVLLSVPKYDFSWQTLYIPTAPLSLPKGTRIECVAHFDNSTANKYNPDASKEVRWGDQTWEEMMIGWISYYYDDAKEEAIKGR